MGKSSLGLGYAASSAINGTGPPPKMFKKSDSSSESPLFAAKSFKVSTESEVVDKQPLDSRLQFVHVTESQRRPQKSAPQIN